MSTAPVSFSELEAAVKPAPIVEAQVTPAAPEPTAQNIPQFTEADAQALRDLHAIGITPQNAQQFVQAKSAMDSLPGLLRTNPGAIFDEISKNDPETAGHLLEFFSDKWFEKYQREHPEERQPTNNGPSRTVASAPNPEIAQLKATVDNLVQRQNQEYFARQQQTLNESYGSTIKGMLDRLPEGVPETTKEYIRLRTKELVEQNVSARDRVSKGIFVDVPKYFAEASAKATADIKAAADKEHAARSGVEARGIKEIVPSAEPVNGTQEGPQQDPIWGDAGLAKDLQKALNQK